MLFVRHSALTLCLCMLTGCGVIDYAFLEPPEETAQELFENGNDAMREKNYGNAAEYYAQLKDHYPFSPYVVDAELSLGDALFLDKEYEAAAEAYKDFEDLHPRHEIIPYVLYQIGMAEMKSFVSIDRPTTMVEEAIGYFQRLQDSYPNTNYAVQAKTEIQNARKLLAEHELYLADVFWNMNNYGSAWRRYTYVAENFSDLPEIKTYAEEKALTAYYKYQANQAETTRQSIEGSWEELFDWL